ncbi:MAG: hypothetical protein V3T17_06885 [Pseudomonadales bacterium]
MKTNLQTHAISALRLNRTIVPALALSCMSSLTMAAFNDAGTHYSTAEQEYHVENDALEPVELVNSILCFTAQMSPNNFVNQGPYVALVDDAACFDREESGGASSQSSGAANQPSFMEVVVDATRATDTSPVQIAVWIPGMIGSDDETEQAIKFKAVISEAPSATNPFGQFTFNFDFFTDINGGTQLGGGEVKTISSIDGSIGFTLFESEQRDNGPEETGTFTDSASVMMSADRSSGSALTASTGGSWSDAYALSFNSDNVLVQSAADYASLPFQSGNNSGSCLSRTTFIESVHQYDLFDAVSGARVELNSGLSFRYDSNNDDVADSWGHVGYWGVWTESDGAVSNGDTIAVENFDTGETTNYTVVTAPGKLIKHTVESLSLSDARGIAFSMWDDSASQQGYESWEVRYLLASLDSVNSDGLYKVAGLNWNEQGSARTELTPTAVTQNANEATHMHSDQLGGSVIYKQGDTAMTFFKEEMINGGSNIFANGDLTLHCVEQCPTGTLDATDLQNWDSPYAPPVTDLANTITYSIGNSGANAFTLVRTSNSEPIRFAAGLTKAQLATSAYGWGFNTGTLVIASVLASLSNPWDIYDPALVTEFYTWETGLDQWNQMASVKDVNGTIVSFDKPLQFTYRHSNSNDRTGNAGAHDGMVLMLSYGGNGDFWGIPHSQNDERYTPLFNLADGTLVGANNEYVVKARSIEGVMADANGQCSALTISAPTVAVPTATTGSADIGNMPVVSGAPKVIAGELQTSE